MRAYLAELIGTFAIVFCGTGSIIINEQTGSVTHLGIALTFGMVVMSMIYALGNISGAHFNPAVSIGFAIAKRFPMNQLMPYLASQFFGAILASILLKFLFPTSELLGATLPSGSMGQSFVLELLLTFFLMLVILQVSSGSKEKGMFAGLAIGSVVAMEALFAGPICGASMNPARSFAPALISWHIQTVWIYVAAPISGAMLASPIWRYFQKTD